MKQLTGPGLFNHTKTLFYIVLFTALFFTSCRSTRPPQYLQGPFDTAAYSQVHFPEPTIQKGDLIGITVFSDNATASAAFNQQVTGGVSTDIGGSGGNTGAANMPQYLVDLEGNILFPGLGPVKVEGLTKAQLAATLQQQLLPHLKNPYCSIRLLNQKFTILGEVTKQGIYSIPGEKFSIFEALGIAGDLTLYAQKDSIMVIREENGKRQFGTLDVSQPEVMLSPYYYLRQNDVVIVKASPRKPTISDQAATRRLTVIATITTILVSISLIVTRFR